MEGFQQVYSSHFPAILEQRTNYMKQWNVAMNVHVVFDIAVAITRVYWVRYIALPTLSYIYQLIEHDIFKISTCIDSRFQNYAWQHLIIIGIVVKLVQVIISGNYIMQLEVIINYLITTTINSHLEGILLLVSSSLFTSFFCLHMHAFVGIQSTTYLLTAAFFSIIITYSLQAVDTGINIYHCMVSFVLISIIFVKHLLILLHKKG